MEKMRRSTCIIAFIIITACLLYSRPEGFIKGRVSDKDGKPLGDVKVEVVESTIATQTLGDGTFVLKNLNPKKYLLLFTHPDYIPQSIEIEVGDKSKMPLDVALLPKNPMLLTVKEEITVTAEADSILDISLPSHRTILPGSVLVELGTSNVAEAVDKIPGVAMVGKGGYSMVPAIRGLAEHRVLLLVDGVRLTSERRIGTSASFINLNDIDRIEVNRGPYSVFHGSGAIGGIINIITKSPHANSPLMGNFLLGYNTVRNERAASFNLSGSQGKYGYMIGINAKKADDYHAPSGKIEQSRYSDYDILLKVNREDKNSQFYITFFNYVGKNIGKPSPTARLKPRWYPQEKNSIFTLGYKVQNKLQLNTFDASFYIYLPRLETGKENLRDDLNVKKRNLARVEGTNFGFKVRGDRRVGKKHTLNFGIDFFGRRNVKDKNTEWNYDSLGLVTEIAEVTSLFDAKRDNFGLYLDDKIQISPSLKINLGARFDIINTSNLIDSGDKISRSDQSFTAYVGSIYQVTSQLSLIANLGRSFRFPSISELFYSGLTGRGTVFGNPNLSSERSINMDFGLRYLHSKFFAAIYGFSNSVSDIIEKYSDGFDEEFFYRNLTKGRVTGVEGEFYFSLVKDFELFVNFHHMKGKERDNERALNYIPASRLTFWTKFSFGKLWAEPKVTLTTGIDDPGPLEVDIDGYILLDAIFGYNLTQDIRLFAIAQNILNQTYRSSADEQGVDAPGRGVVFKILYSF